jgi:hypothetical protein
MNKTIQRFKGYLNTPLLWEHNSIQDLEQFELHTTHVGSNEINVPDKIRLGKLVELFVFFQLEQNQTIEVLAQNLQVIHDKVTIGELDCILRNLESYIHMEIVYKFYLYDKTMGPLEIDKWIGPNRKDSLSQKLNKLTHKQLAIIDHFKTKELLLDLGLDLHVLKQKVFFKAQLYVPKSLLKSTFEVINNSCIMGCFIGMSEYLAMHDFYFYMPPKLDWLIDPHADVKWLTHKEFTPYIEAEINQSRSPLCWMQNKEGAVQKLFVVFWKG